MTIAVKKPIRRSTKYKENMPCRAEELCREKGYTDKQLAQAFKCSRDSIYTWKLKYPEFAEAIQRGKDEFDTEVVENALLKRALGYEYEEKTYEKKTRDKDEDGEPVAAGDDDLVLVKTVTKYEPGNVTAQIFWLKNRNSQRWRDKQDIEHSGKIEFETVNYGSADKNN